MTDTISRRTARHLLLGSAGAALAIALAATPALAQTATVTGNHTLTSEQSNQGATTLATASSAGAQITLTGQVQASSIALADDAIYVTARGNQAANSFAPDLIGDGETTGTHFSVDSSGITANGNVIVASDQRNVASPVQATMIQTVSGLTANGASSASLGVERNSADALAKGNDAVNVLTIDARGAVAGAGMIANQKTDRSSPVSAYAMGATSLGLGAASQSSLTVSDNLSRALAYGNAAEQMMSVTAGGLGIPAGGNAASIVPTSPQAGAATVDAAFAVLANQSLGGNVAAQSGYTRAPLAIDIALSGDLDASSANLDRNALVAAGYGNQSANRLDLHANDGRGTPASAGHGAIANVTGVQRIDRATVSATTMSGIGITVAGHLADAALTASGNGLRTVATGNLADGNFLTVEATHIAGGNGAFLPTGPVGTAMSGADGTSSVTAPLSVQNVQDAGTAIITSTQNGGAIILAANGAIDRSTLRAENNSATATATANSATNAATITAAALDAGVDVNNVQTADSIVQTDIGSTAAPAGVSIMPGGRVAGSSLSVTGNMLAGTAIGNKASNAVSVDAGTITNSSGHSDATSGPIGNGYGAAASFALANNQKLGQPGAGTAGPASVTSNVTGRSTIGGAGLTLGDNLTLDDNQQSAAAVGNSVQNRLIVSAATIDSATSPAAGSALSSSQYGEATIAATSTATLGVRAGVNGSTISMSSNTNHAVAVTNEADNALGVSATTLDGVTGDAVHAHAGSLGLADIVGDQVLANEQFATGSTRAVADATLVNSDAAGALTSSRLTLADTSIFAEATANRAVNAVTVSRVSGTPMNAGIASSQMSDSNVLASATARMTVGLGPVAGAPALYGSSVSIDGNVTSATARGNEAENTLNSTSVTPMAPTTATTQTGRFDASVDAPLALLNSQSNYGAVTASTAGSYGLPLNATAPVISSSATVGNNSFAATAYGNVATNQMTLTSGAAPGASLSSVQSNYGPVTASVAASTVSARAGTISNGTLSITGNALTALATGNLSSGTVNSAH